MQGIDLPNSVVLGPVNCEGGIQGSLVSPAVITHWEAPDAEAQGTVSLSICSILVNSPLMERMLFRLATFVLGVACRNPNT